MARGIDEISDTGDGERFGTLIDELPATVQEEALTDWEENLARVRFVAILNRSFTISSHLKYLCLFIIPLSIFVTIRLWQIRRNL